MLNNLLQGWIVFTSVVSIVLVTSSGQKARRIGCLVGLAGSPAWLLSTSAAGQSGMYVVSIVFALSYLRGIFPDQVKKIIKVLFP